MFSLSRFKRVVAQQGWKVTLWRIVIMLLWVIPVHTIGVLIQRFGEALKTLGFWLQVIGLKAVGRHPYDL